MVKQENEFTGVWIPKHIIEDKNLKIVEKYIYAEVGCFDVCFLSNGTIARRAGCSEDTVSRAISKLTELGYLELVSFDGRVRRLRTRKDLPTQIAVAAYANPTKQPTPVAVLDNNIEYKEITAVDATAPTLKEKEQTPQERKTALIAYVKSLSASPRKDVALIGKYYLKYWNEYGFPNDLSVSAFRELNLTKKRFAQLKRIVSLDIPESRIDSKLREGIQRNGDKFIFEFFINSLGR